MMFILLMEAMIVRIALNVRLYLSQICLLCLYLLHVRQQNIY
mgnify:FL=1